MTELLPWYAARLLFEAGIADEAEEEPLFEERLVLVHAEDGLDAARAKACEMGESSYDSYENADGETVTWSFREVLEVVQLNEKAIGDGSEIYHRYLSSSELKAVRKLLKAS